MSIDTPLRPSIDTTSELSIDDPSSELYRAAHILASLSIDTNAVISIDSPSSPRHLPLARQSDHSSRKWVVPGTGPGVLPNGDPGRLLAGTQRPAFPRQDIAPEILLSRVPLRPEPHSEPGGGLVGAFDGVFEMAEPGALVIPEEEA
ncbi:hypothetical protein F2Q69_00036205 [Brassica cretica]|uniref:Uncharacterized protein n=1 Tax=Brassica cretica TaxID=69181 RepID=A0A8S9SBU4_BRACR|nr:hypothetical protein F2Q69_00036205 [Brassica cretica]